MPSPTSLRRLAATGCLAIALSASAAGRDGAGRVLPAPSSDGGLALVARGGRA